MDTLTTLSARHGVELNEHLIADAEVPVLTGIQRQGDVIVVPTRAGADEGLPVPPEGIAVVRGENGGNTHLLVADGAVTWRAVTAQRGQLALGVVTVPEGSTAYLAHPEHGFMGIAPGTYRVSRQREQADEIRVVAD